MQDDRGRLKEKLKWRLKEICFSITGVTIVTILIWAILLIIFLIGS